VALLFCATTAAMAQTTSGRIRGTVTDPDGNAMPGVTILITGEALQGADRTAVTGETGDYRVSAIPPGSYIVTARMEGFVDQVLEGLQVAIGSTATANFVLNQAFEEIVTVSSTPLVDVSSSSVATAYTADFIEDLPTNRNFYDMISVSAGITLATEDSDRQIAYGSDVQTNSWHIDGIETKAPETGTAWVYVNPDMVEEIQVLGIGAPAEYGNMQGAAFNVVTKSGTDNFRGTANVYWLDDNLVDSDIGFKESEFQEYHQDNFQDITATLGGPIWKERVWFFAAYEYWRDNHTFPGSDPAINPEWYADRYDLKLTARVNDSNTLNIKGYYDDWGYPDPANEFATPSASAGEIGDTTAWGFSWESILSNRTYLEARYSGWSSNDDYLSQTGSQEPAFIDWTPAGGGPPTYSGGVWWPWQYDTSTDQVSLTVSHFADDFLKGDHDFKFGVSANDGEAITLISPSATGDYYYHYLYEYDYYGYIYEYDYFVQVFGQPYFYGNEQESWAAFVDDSWAVTDRLTLNIGLRYDYHKGVTPAFNRPRTGEVIPGIDPVFEWKKFSPRFGFAYNAGPERKTVIRGSVGLYYNGNVGGNWNSPPPQTPTLEAFASLNGGPYEPYWEWSAGENNVDPNLEPPKTWQYALGFEHEFQNIYSVGVMGVYKDSSNSIGWEFLDDGVYSTFEFTDPGTGRTYTLRDYEVFPTTRKGNGPGYTSAGYFPDYWQEYWALVTTFSRRFSNRWDMRANYTYQNSEGLNPRALSQWQNNPLYGSKEGSHPNQWFNVDGEVQSGNRPHMFRVQSNVALPWDVVLSGALNIQSGRPYFRQIRAPYDTQAARQDYFVAEQLRHPTQTLIDLSIGKRFSLPGDGEFKVDLQLFNLLNDDSTDWWEDVRLAQGDTFRANTWVKPRRLMIRLGIEY
jgi:hypothetical protein